MGIFRLSIAMSLDGFCAGPEQSVENPLGIGGMQLHQWALDTEAWRESHGYEGGEANNSSEVIAETTENVGAVVMGRNMFGGGPGPWNESEPWNGWWGDDPPFHVPVFVLTHHPRDPLSLGDTTFHFVTDGIESALEQARQAAGDADITLGGGGSVVHQYLGGRTARRGPGQPRPGDPRQRHPPLR